MSRIIRKKWMSTLIKSILLLFLIVGYVWGGAVDFDGTDDCFQVNSTMSMSALTISTWINVDSTSGYQMIVTRDDVGTTSANWWFGIEGAGALTLASNNSVSGWQNTTTAAGVIASTGTWYHLIVTHDGSNPGAQEIFVDNVSKATSGHDGTLSSSQEVEFGARISCSSLRLNGRMGPTCIWDTNLSSNEINLLFTSGVTGAASCTQIRPDNLVGFWVFDAASRGNSFDGIVEIDRSGNGNNATGDDGANNTGLTAQGETRLTYP